MAVIHDPSFEDAGNGGPGTSGGWNVSSSGALDFRYAGYQQHTIPPDGAYAPWEWFESGWNNDSGYFHLLSQVGVTYFGIDPEGFTGWPGYDMTWREVFGATDLAAALYATYPLPPSVAPATYWVERFDSDWSNDEVPQGAHRYLFINGFEGDPPSYVDPSDGLPKYVVGTQTKVRMWLGRLAGVWTIFDGTVTMTPGLYTATALRAHLQALTNAALVAAGAPFGAGNISWVVNPKGGLFCRNNKSGFYLRLLHPLSLSAWEGIGFELFDLSWYGGAAIETTHAAPYKDTAVALALFDGALDTEWFEFGWSNYFDEYYWAAVPWVDGDETGPFSIQAGVNDAIWLWLDDFGGNSLPLLLTLTPGVYTAAAMAVEITNQLDIALVAAGAPWGAGDAAATTNTSGQVRIINNGGIIEFDMFLMRPLAASAWDTLGFDVESPYGPLMAVDRHTRRYSGEKIYVLATYDLPGPGQQVEDFEDPTWPPIP